MDEAFSNDYIEILERFYRHQSQPPPPPPPLPRQAQLAQPASQGAEHARRHRRRHGARRVASRRIASSVGEHPRSSQPWDSK